MVVKIVVFGSVDCALRPFFTKLAKLQAKNSFSIAIVLGELFGAPSTETELQQVTALLEGVISVPLPTYFTLGNTKLPERVIERLRTDNEVCPNLFFLGRRSTTKTSEGIRIVALGGQHNTATKSSNAADADYSPMYTDSDARSLNGAHHADILVTNQWPHAVQTGSKVIDPENMTTAPQGVKCVADLCSVLKPRYHFSTSPDLSYEREPFFHPPTEENTAARPITRFISLASFGNSSNQKSSNMKWLYAFSLDPEAEQPSVLPPGTTASPFATIPRKRQALPGQQETYSRFVYGDEYHRPEKRQRLPPLTPAECFFCLSNPNLATHLITSIGDDAYLTTAKGPLTTSKTFPSLGFPCHILIIPLTHSPTLATIPETAARVTTYKEMQRYRGALHTMLQQKSNGDLGSVTWEVSRAGGVHLHWQFLPVSAEMVRRGLVEAAFEVEAENDYYPKVEKRDVSDGTAERDDYFRVWLWGPGEHLKDGSQNGSEETARETSLILPLSPDLRFDVQFGRRVLAKLLNLDRRANWKDAVQTQSDEETDAKTFKEAFKSFDFSLME